MPYYCTVPRCTSMAGKAKNVSFHQFPRDEELAKLWNRILKRGKPYTKYSKVCSLHFKPEDYTITSVGKNKGQWRTLRKDAIPSQNLPSESPVPYTRRSSGCWVPNQPNLTDPLAQQQVAQAIYMQTMLAMQAAGASEPLASEPQTSESTKPSPSSSSLSEIELLLRRDADTPKEDTYKCHECSKCFKDPDVFLLHKRTHKNNSTLNIEKENYSANIQDREETLRANPILANLLKTSMRLEPESNMANILTVENQIMAALASNMEAYIRTLSSMLASQSNAMETEDNDRGSDYDETKDEDNGEDKDAEVKSEDNGEDKDAKVKSEDDGEDKDAKVKGEDNGEDKDAKVKSEDNEFRKDKCVDKNEHDTPMDENEDDDHRNRTEEGVQYESRDDIHNHFSNQTAENTEVTRKSENHSKESSHTKDDNLTRDVISEALNDTQMDENCTIASDDKSINSDTIQENHNASNNTHNNSSINSNETDSTADEVQNNGIVQDTCGSDNKIPNKTEIEEGNTDENDKYTVDDKRADENSRIEACEVDKALADVNNASDAIDDDIKDEMVDDKDGKLAQRDPACDSSVETLELVKMDIEFERIET